MHWDGQRNDPQHFIDTSGMQEVCAKMMPGLLSDEQKATQMNSCKNIFQQMEADKKVLESVITGNESWVLQFHLETKRQSHQWKSVSLPSPKKTYMQQSHVKVMPITFFDNQGMVHYKFVPQGKAFN